ncbi:hypothetical protein [Shewanella indica]|uniref:hypothetical protein n=1 Tax=Shewanella indica TaxID=768528 RepID=UPI0020443D71|nr:hypothetical protein [Shewanella indica]
MTDNTQDIITFIREDNTLYRALGFYLKYIMPGDPVEAVPLDWRFHENYTDPDYQKRFLAGDWVGVLASHIDRLVHCPDSIDEGWSNLVSNAVGGWVRLFDVEPVIPFDEYLALIGDGEDVHQLEHLIDEQLPEGVDVESEIESVLERVQAIRSNAGYMKMCPSALKALLKRF